MAVLALILRNVLRHRFRTAMTLGAVAVGVAALILAGGFVRDIFIQLGEAIVHSQTGHIQILRPGMLGAGSRSPEKHLLDRVERLRAEVRKQPGTSDVMARLSFSGLLNNGRSDLSVIGQGVEPERESRMGTYTTIVQGRQLADGDRYGALIGEGVANAMRLAPGDRVVLLANTTDGALNTLDLDIVGVFRSFSREFDARAVRVSLPAAQELLGTSGVNALVVVLAHTPDAGSVATSLRRELAGQDVEVRTWNELDDFYDKTVELYRRQFGVLEIVVLVMVLLSVANTVNMSVFERTAEFGTMRAIGNTGRQVFTRVVLENAVIGLAGAALGALLAIGLATLLSAIGIPMPPPPNSNMAYTAQIRLVPSVIVTAMAIGAAATVLASLLPARRAAHIPIADALRHSI